MYIQPIIYLRTGRTPPLSSGLSGLWLSQGHREGFNCRGPLCAFMGFAMINYSLVEKQVYINKLISSPL